MDGLECVGITKSVYLVFLKIGDLVLTSSLRREIERILSTYTTWYTMWDSCVQRLCQEKDSPGFRFVQNKPLSIQTNLYPSTNSFLLLTTDSKVLIKKQNKTVLISLNLSVILNTSALTTVSCNLLKHAMCIFLCGGQKYSVRGQMAAAPVWYSRLFTLKHHMPSRESNQD